MNILVINVSLRPKSPLLFPIGLGYIVTALHEAKIGFDLLDIDAQRYTLFEVETLISRKKYDVVCMGCIVTGYKIIKELAEIIKKSNSHSLIIVGNSVATSITQTLLTKTKVDVAVMGEGDETIVDLINHIASSEPLENVAGICIKHNDRILKTTFRPLIRDLSALPHINFSLFDIERYIDDSKNSVSDPLPFPRERARALPISTARGCIAKCNFCYHVFRDHPFRYRSAESIVNEVKKLTAEYSLNYIHFWDELTFFSKKQALETAQRILDENLSFYWAANCRANLFDCDDDLPILHKMREAGCISVGYSLESADAGILKSMNKNISVDQFSRQTSLFHKAKIYPVTSLVLGYPQETAETIKKTFDCCIYNKIYPSAGYLLPFPGSEMYDYAQKHGYIDDEEHYLFKLGDRQDLRVNMTNMTDRELEECVLEGLQRCNKELNLGLSGQDLIKTQYYRSNKTCE